MGGVERAIRVQPLSPEGHAPSSPASGLRVDSSVSAQLTNGEHGKSRENKDEKKRCKDPTWCGFPSRVSCTPYHMHLIGLQQRWTIVVSAQ